MSLVGSYSKLPDGAEFDDYDDTSPKPPNRAFASLDELRFVEKARELFFDENGSPTPLYTLFAATTSTELFEKTNLNSASPETLKMMLDAEKEYGGRALAFAGECLLCGDEKCTRPLGKPCRHPQKVRPSLEACGFDVNKIAEELLGIEIKWGHDNKMPEYLLLTCAFAHNQDNISTEW